MSLEPLDQSPLRVESTSGGLFRPEALMLSGRIAEIQTRITVYAQAADTSRHVDQRLAQDDASLNLTMRVSKDLSKSLGEGYRLEPVVSVPPHAFMFAISSGYVEIPSGERLARSIGKLASAIERCVLEYVTEGLARSKRSEVVVDSSWEVHPSALRGYDQPTAESTDEQLRARLGRLVARRREQAAVARRTGVMALTLVSLTMLIVPLAVILGDGFITLIAVVYTAPLTIVAIVVRLLTGGQLRETEADVRAVSDELDLRRIGNEDPEMRAQKLFQAHGGLIKRYYDQALGQARQIYYVGVGCIVLGIAVIAATFALILSRHAGDLSEQIIIGALGAIGAVLTNFIALIYLRMFSDSVSALTGFHGRLVQTHHLHFGNFLASKIDDEEARSAALAAMAIGLADLTSGDQGASSPNSTVEPEPTSA